MSEKDLNQVDQVDQDVQTTAADLEDKAVEETVAGEKNDREQQVQLEELQKQNEELTAKLEEAENRMLRMQADFENARRRARLDLEATEKYRSQSLITALLPSIDNFERALQVETGNEQAKSLLQGMDMIYRGLLEALKAEGVVQIEAEGKEFDPHLHQAIMQVEDENFDSNIVVEELQKGYMLKDRVIRPSMVKVNQ